MPTLVGGWTANPVAVTVLGDVDDDFVANRRDADGGQVAEDQSRFGGGVDVAQHREHPWHIDPAVRTGSRCSRVPSLLSNKVGVTVSSRALEPRTASVLQSAAKPAVSVVPAFFPVADSGVVSRICLLARHICLPADEPPGPPMMERRNNMSNYREDQVVHTAAEVAEVKQRGGATDSFRWRANLWANVPAAIAYANQSPLSPAGAIIFNIRDNGQVWTYDLG